MKYITKLVVAMVVICMLQGCCPNPSSREGAARARALTNEQLHTLYTQMEHFYKGGKYIVWGGEKSPIPREFARIGAYSGDVGHLNRLLLGGCYDDKASLVFDGLDGTGPRRIRLFPGEMIPAEVLWEDKDSTNVGLLPLSGAEPNYAIKVTSVKILVSSFASGASAPYFGC